MDAVSIGILVVLGVLVISLVTIFNRLVALKNRFKNAFSQIEVQLKRRYDLIPNMVEVAKRYMQHEQDTLTKVIEARNMASRVLQAATREPGGAGAMRKLGEAEGALAGAMGGLNFVMEQYPDLKANENMMQLSEEISSTENKVAFARQAYNDEVMLYNTYRQSFPNN
ncbi:MAG: LemA family protein, partial [Nitrospirota bacterium]|nr:LemA family protein [Nitrospirota bacterium]